MTHPPRCSYRLYGWTLFALAMSAHIGAAAAQNQYVTTAPGKGAFPIVSGNEVATIYVDANDHAGVIRAAGDLQADIHRVTDRDAAITHDDKAPGTNAILIGTIGKSALIDRLIDEGKIDTFDIAGKWESFFLQVVEDPLPGVDSALVIVGSDKRGTIYGIYDLSQQIGVSPWHWWADVPPKRAESLYVTNGKYVRGPPAVKYRGIFLNDEAPALSGWVREKYGDYNHEFYEHVFELILRLKGNYLWPAMWGNAFNEDDPENPRLADEYGIVMGTSHHEPMLRAQQEWRRHGAGEWNYATNAEVLREFWAAGVERNKNYESIITIGMRGDGDEPMVEGGDMAANVALLEQIVADQRALIAEHVNPDVTAVPQLWALYKEVQEYYEAGMRVPDDVTLLWCDDNWGNIRRLPTPEERARAGGAGIYYHFDYVGGPRSYKWLNTIPITKVWEQMNLAYEYGADRIWIVNVGDLKPMEFPIEFFLTMAWDPRRFSPDNMDDYTRDWAQRQFGPEHAYEIADLIAKYTKYNGRRKPELLEPATFSIMNYGEADRVLDEWRQITESAQRIHDQLPPESRDAFFQLVLYPVKASAIVTEMYIAAGKNEMYARLGRASANDYSQRVRQLLHADAEMSAAYHALGGGKWNHMMSQTRLGYTFWNQPSRNVSPAVAEVMPSEEAEMGVAMEFAGFARFRRFGWGLLTFDVFNRQQRYIDIFNRGRTPFQFTAATDDPWIILTPSPSRERDGVRVNQSVSENTISGTVEKETRLWVSIDWSQAPAGMGSGTVTIVRTDGEGWPFRLRVPTFKPDEPTPENLDGFVEADGYVSIEAEHYTHKHDTDAARWQKIEDFGRTLSAMTIFPVTAAGILPPDDAPRLEYKMYLFRPGEVEVTVYLAPTLNFVPGRGLRYAIAFDDQPPQVIDALDHVSPDSSPATPSQLTPGAGSAWEEAVRNGVHIIKSKHTLTAAGADPSPGYHTLKVWMVDPAVVLEKIVVDTGGLRPSYLGPPESFRGGRASIDDP